MNREDSLVRKLDIQTMFRKVRVRYSNKEMSCTEKEIVALLIRKEGKKSRCVLGFTKIHQFQRQQRAASHITRTHYLL